MKDNKNRLYELMYKVGGVNKQLLCEENLPLDKKQLIVNDFISYVSERINIGDNNPNVDVVFDETNFTEENKSFGQYNPNTFEIKIIGYNRNLADTLRTLAHELIHHKQNIDGELNEKSGETGSDHENEANAFAGQLMREYGKKNPKIFE
jgi:Zn-dependent peptidase ImmA (M78 family)